MAEVSKSMAKSETRPLLGERKEIKAEVKPIDPTKTEYMSGSKEITSLRNK